MSGDVNWHSLEVKCPADVRVFENPGAVAHGAATLLAETMAQSTGAVAVALAGGSTPTACYRALSGEARYKDAFPWSRAHWFFGDERQVPPESTESNYHMAKESLFDPASVALNHIHRVQAELPDASEAAARYHEELLEYRRGHSVDAFDVMLLGMGDDGHTASLFPHTDVLKETAPGYRSVWVPRLDTWRMTVTPPELHNAKQILVMVTGVGKALRLAEIFNGPMQPEATPIQFLFQREKPAIWLLDEHAAKLI
jgi:6-phosphogluconolactonase